MDGVINTGTVAPRKTKIVATLGPQTCDVQSIANLINAGLSVVRLNGAHNELTWHEAVVRNVRSVDPMIPILVDLPGRKIRTKDLAEPHVFKKGDLVIFSTSPDAEQAKVPVSYGLLHNELKNGDTILADDGTLKFTVQEIVGNEIRCVAECDGAIKSRKGLNIPYVQVKTPLLSARDLQIIEFCKRLGVDFVGVSFVEGREHVEEVRKALSNSEIGIVAKVENQFGVNNLEEIVMSADVIMIDRGDLGAETRSEKVGTLQKKILKQAQMRGTPVIVATEMLHTMIQSPTPTKAEIIDITNAVLDGASAVMLSGESAVGKFPVQSVTWMASVIREAEEFQESTHLPTNSGNLAESIGRTAVEIAQESKVDKIVCISYTGYAPKMISRFRGSSQVLAVTDTIEKARRMNIYWGVEAVPLKIRFTPRDISHIEKSLRTLWEQGLISERETIVIVAARYPHDGGKMNSIEVQKVGDLAKVLSWGKTREVSDRPLDAI